VNHVLRRQDRLAEHYNEGLSNWVLSRATNTLQNTEIYRK
jgi:hypothetical protein